MDGQRGLFKQLFWSQPHGKPDLCRFLARQRLESSAQLAVFFLENMGDTWIAYTLQVSCSCVERKKEGLRVLAPPMPHFLHLRLLQEKSTRVAQKKRRTDANPTTAGSRTLPPEMFSRV